MLQTFQKNNEFCLTPNVCYRLFLNTLYKRDWLHFIIFKHVKFHRDLLVFYFNNAVFQHFSLEVQIEIWAFCHIFVFLQIPQRAITWNPKDIFFSDLSHIGPVFLTWFSDSCMTGQGNKRQKNLLLLFSFNYTKN